MVSSGVSSRECMNACAEARPADALCFTTRAQLTTRANLRWISASLGPFARSG
jgi:hypothetical protein